MLANLEIIKSNYKYELDNVQKDKFTANNIITKSRIILFIIFRVNTLPLAILYE